jgi:hypothetical protein
MSKTIVTTWEISFQRLLETHPDAAALLTVFGLLDGSEISKQVLLDGFTAERRWADHIKHVTAFFDGTPAFIRDLRGNYSGQGLNHAIRKPISYSLLFQSDRSDREKIFYMHPVSQSRYLNIYWAHLSNECSLFIFGPRHVVQSSA